VLSTVVYSVTRRPSECIYRQVNFQLRESRDSGYAPFRTFLRSHVRTVPVDVLVKFEVRSFECIVCEILQSCAHRYTDRQTDTHTDKSENIISASFVAFTWRT